MRSVIRNPLTILVTAAVMAMNPSTSLSVDGLSLMIRIAPTTEIAEIALVSDINGVCSNGDTLRMTSNPTNVASMKTYRPISRLDGIHHLLHARMHNLPAVRHQRLAHDFVLAIQHQLAVLDQVPQKRRDILGIHLAGVIRNRGRQIERSDYPHTVPLHGLSGTRQLAVAAALRGDIDNHRAWRHARRHFARDQNRCLLARDGGGRD